MMKRTQRGAGIFLALMLCFLFTHEVRGESRSEGGLELTPQSIISFSNAVSHYVSFDISFHGADRLTVRVYTPEGLQASFTTRQKNHYGQKAVKALYWTVNQTDTKKTGTEIYFKKGCKTGTWKITVTAEDKQKNALDTATLEVYVREKDPLECADYEKVHEMILNGDEPVEAGKIRLVTQMTTDRCYVRALWKGKIYDLTEKSTKMCTRAVFSMAVSFLGIDCSPVRMSDISKNTDLFYTYEELAEKLGGICRKEGTVEELWELYEEGLGSPVCIHFSYPGEGMHAMLLIARDSRNPEMYYAVNPSFGVNATSIGGLKHDHVIPVLIDEGKVGCMIQSPLDKKYNGGKLDSIWYWEKTE